MARRSLQIVNCHAAGEVGDVIVDGVETLPGATVNAQAQFLAANQQLRNFVLNEPRGGVFRHVNLLVPAVSPEADFGFIIMEPEDTPPMSGSNCMCVAAVLLHEKLVPMVEPQTKLKLEAPGGIVEIGVHCEGGEVESVTIQNLPSFPHLIGQSLNVPGLPKLTVDVAFGGDTFVLIDAEELELDLVPSEARNLAELGIRITQAAKQEFEPLRNSRNEQRPISFCCFRGPVRAENGVKVIPLAVAIQPGKIDRSPCGTASSAVMAILHQQGQLELNETLITESIIGSQFECRIISSRPGQPFGTVIPEITGRPWVFGRQSWYLDPDDPFPQGYRLGDTWPQSNSRPDF